MATQSHPGVFASRHVNELAAGVFGAVFIVIGLLGFTVSGGHDVAGHTGGELFGLFQVNVLHNIVHMAVGVAMVAAAFAGLRAARMTNIVIGAVYLLLGIVGLFITGDNTLNVIALNPADNGLHLVLGIVLLAVGLGTDRR